MSRSLSFTFSTLTALAMSVAVAACDDNSKPTAVARDPKTSPLASVDRFSDQAATLMRRSAAPTLPAANQPIAFDGGAPFITEGLGPTGQRVKYYNFDIQPTAPAPIYAFFTPDGTPVADQLNVVDVIPGDTGYSDFWRVQKVTVPASYVANSATSFAEIQAAGYSVAATDMLVNCPIVPDGSTAALRLAAESPALHAGWYKGKVVKYFSFDEKALAGAVVPLAPIFVAFNVNPDQPGGGPPSGFETEPASPQTHNVVTVLPADAGYSPLWSVNVYNNAAFASVANLTTAQAAPLLGMGVANVNCPIVSVN